MFVMNGLVFFTDPFFFKNNLYICPMTHREDLLRFKQLQTEALQKRVEELEAKLEILTQKLHDYELYK